MPFSIATRRTCAASMPRPSSTMVMTTWFDSWAAESRIVPVADLPLASRSAGLSMPWSTLLRIMWTRGSADLVDDRLVDPRVLALEDELDLLALALREVAHQAGEAVEDGPDGEHPDVHDRLLELGADAGHVLHRVKQVARALGPARSCDACFPSSWSLVR